MNREQWINEQVALLMKENRTTYKDEENLKIYLEYQCDLAEEEGITPDYDKDYYEGLINLFIQE